LINIFLRFDCIQSVKYYCKKINNNNRQNT
jgi:hypothetical protein